jgi:hypothetical protein
VASPGCKIVYVKGDGRVFAVAVQCDGGVESCKTTHVLVPRVSTTKLVEHDAGWRYQRVAQGTDRLIVEINIAASVNCEATRMLR